jgi:hypothetical protein
MTRAKVFSLGSVVVVSWLAACGSAFEGSSGSGGSANTTGGSGQMGKGGNTSGGAQAGKGGAAGAGSGGSSSGTAGSVEPGEGGDGNDTGGTQSGTAGAPAMAACRVGALENVLLCDDFEDPEHPGWEHNEDTGDDGSTIYVNNPVHQGMGAIKSTKTSPGPLDPLFSDALGENTTGRLYARVWMFIPGTTAISNDPLANASLLVLGEAPPSDGGVSVVLWSSAVTVQVYDPNNSDTPSVQAGSYATTLPRDAWFCLRLDFPIGDNLSVSDFKLRVDDDVFPNAEADKVLSTTLSAPYERLWVGVNYISPQQASAVTVYYDDVAVDTSDLGCE